MGWFDQEGKDKAAPSAPTAAKPAAPANQAPAAPGRPAQAGSTLGERIHINGTILTEEPLTILGRVEGTIRSHQTLHVAQSADVRAVIHGKAVVVEGTVTGDVNGSDSVVLGPTAVLHGNINTPALRIQEGAFFKGAVEMPAPAKPAPKSQPEKPTPHPASKPAPAEVAATGGKAKPEREAKAGTGS